MLVVANSGNLREEAPVLNMKEMMSDHEVVRNEDWFPVFKRNCSRVAVTGDSWHSLVSIRGSIFESSNHAFDEIRVGGIRCPIHNMKSICKLGNKTIVDLVVAIDPTAIDSKWSGWTFDITFPSGFTPLCYVSSNQPLQYLAIVFESIGIMAVDITPVSFSLIWDIPERSSVELNGNIIASEQYHKLEVLNATPGTDFVVKVNSEVSDAYATVSLQTPLQSFDNMKLFYASRKRNLNSYDLVGVKSETVTYLRKEGIIEGGQQVKLTENTEVSVVVSGDSFSVVDGKNMYIVPDYSVDEDQFVCLEDESQASHVVKFDKSESYVEYNDQIYPHGTSFTMTSSLPDCRTCARTFAVVKGSIILVVENILTDFPGGNEKAAQIMSSGDLVIRDLLMRSSFQVTEKVDGEMTYGKNSFYVYNPVDGTTKECTRISYGLTDAGDTGSMSLDVLDGNTDGIVNTLWSDPYKTSITSRNDTEILTATFNTGGLSFDSDKGDIYFGADKDFRIHFQDQSGLDPAMLQIQSLGSDNAYVTRFLITAEPP